jgi:hypothetical protein
MKAWLAADAKVPLETLRSLLSLRGEIHLLHFAKSAVFSLPEENIVAKVSRPGAELEDFRRGMRFANWLEDRGLPGSRLAGEMAQEPYRIGEHYLSFWRMDNFRPVRSGAEFGQALRSFHSEINPFPERLPDLDPLADIAAMLESLREDYPADVDLLWSWHHRLGEEWGATESLLGAGPLHGNAHRGNSARRGRDLCMLDYELLSWGPREWDLVPEALRLRRYGQAHRDYELFSRTYGFDVFSWPGFQNMVLVRELLATVFRMLADAGLGGETESRRRLLYWRGKPSPIWRGF